MSKIVVRECSRIEITDDSGGFVAAVDVDRSGVTGTSGRWFIERGDGQRVEFSSTELLQRVYEIGNTHAITPPAKGSRT